MHRILEPAVGCNAPVFCCLPGTPPTHTEEAPCPPRPPTATSAAILSQPCTIAENATATRLVHWLNLQASTPSINRPCASRIGRSSAWKISVQSSQRSSRAWTPYNARQCHRPLRPAHRNHLMRDPARDSRRGGVQRRTRSSRRVPFLCEGGRCGPYIMRVVRIYVLRMLRGRLRGGAGQPPPAAAPAPAPPQPQAAADTDAPICGRCGVHRVGRRRNGSYFNTCYDCGG